VIRKAVLLAAGRGARLGALTTTTPKPLLDVAGRPIIEHIVGALDAAAVAEIAIVTGYLGEQIAEWARSFVARNKRSRIQTVTQRELNGTAGALTAARDFVAGETAFIFGWGDILMSCENYPRFVESARASDADLILTVNRVDDPWRGAAVYVDANWRVQRVMEKPPRGTSTTNWNDAGLFAATALIWKYVDALRPSARGELELPQAIAAMVEDGRDVRAVDVRGFWSDVGTPEDLQIARRNFA